MARPTIVRSMNYELADGATEGSVKKTNPNRADFGYDRTDDARQGLFRGEGGYGLNPAGSEALDLIRGVVKGY